MCGIAGIFEKQGSKQIPQYLHQMMDKLAHRGPDDEGYVLVSPYPELAIVPLTGKHTNPQTKKELQGGSILEADSNIWIGGIGHRRLSIFDTSAAGHQPMLRENYAIVFNGAIYNYRELRADLEKEGYKFKSNSDTEVLLAGYMHWQERVLPKLDGMFSFSIIDLANNKLFAARDRLGVKPFYYLDDPQWFAFASEQKALYGLPICNQRISKSAVFEYLVQGKNDGQTTGIVKSVLELMPGSCLEYYFDTSTTKVSVWYALDSNQKSESYKEGSYKRYRDKVSQLLTTSVALHLRSDVPLGACLSGGIDSSALVGIASELLQKSNPSFTGLPVFTASFPGNSFDETLLAQQTAQNLGAT
jgi:asparagine synthase (glutamine-hydrolysing)